MRTAARLIFALTAVFSITGMICATISSIDATQYQIAALGDGLDPAVFRSAYERVINVYSYFTVQSNLLVTLVSIALLINPQRASTVFRVARLTSLGAILITALVYNLVLLPLAPPHGFALFFNVLLHMVVPLFAVLGWLAWGPRIPFQWNYIWLSLLFAVWWIGVALIRGAIIHWYNYPFIDVNKLGYGRVALNTAAIAVAYVLILMAVLGVDEKLSSRGALHQ
ncbi:MAG: Pr6Pr family membrane protein [Mycolicibacterium sp.]|uniref:Pr6Pr family membrane protein n=1 Tax=Mycolicibacterium sp. TaxID=2320850 RepID=UPI003D0D1D2E